MGDKFYAGVIICAFVSLFVIVSGILFTFTPPEYYLYGAMVDVVFLIVGVIAMTKIRLPGDRKDLG